ncbi:DUF2889 domain-containing protein [Cupriavidus sp. RAF20_2]|uniref:DUF2889 domain-containing protein n=1 Tax=Cupriavidus sp. RAF20_2 TaxID=3233053 RepID=UPI003F8F69A3
MANAVPDATTPPGRTLRHTRSILCRGYLRDDGRYDIEAEMQDISAVATELPFTDLPAGGHLHRMHLTMTVDAGMVIHHFAARTETGPTPYCAEINAAYATLIGLHIGKGFHQAARQRLAGVRGCTHLTDLLGPLATTAMQTMMSIQREETPWHTKLHGSTPLPQPWVLDTCHAYRLDGEAAQVIWPMHRRAAPVRESTPQE